MSDDVRTNDIFELLNEVKQCYLHSWHRGFRTDLFMEEVYNVLSEISDERNLPLEDTLVYGIFWEMVTRIILTLLKTITYKEKVSAEIVIPIRTKVKYKISVSKERHDMESNDLRAINRAKDDKTMVSVMEEVRGFITFTDQIIVDLGHIYLSHIRSAEALRRVYDHNVVSFMLKQMSRMDMDRLTLPDELFQLVGKWL
jgi:hypothetical protein